MASRPVKLKLLPRSTMKAKNATRLVGQVLAGDGAVVVKESGSFTVSFDPSFIDGLIFPVSIARGGTGLDSFATGDILYASATDTLSRMPATTTGYALTSNGVGVAPSFTGFLQEGTGAVVRSWQDKAAETVSVADFGAVGDGTTDDYAAIQAACDAVSSNGGGVVLFQNKSYLTNSTIEPPSGVMLQGVAGTTILNGQTNQPAVKIGNGTDQFFGGGCSQINFAGQTGVTGVSGQCGLSIAKVGQFRVEGCLCFNSPSALYDGIIIDTGTQFFYNYNRTYNCTNAGVKWTTCNDVYAVSNHSDANAVGLLAIACSGVYGSDFTAYDNTGNAFYLAKSGSNLNHFWFIRGWIGDTSGGENWKITALYDAALEGCWGSTQRNGAVTTAQGFTFSGDACRDIRLIGCTAVNNNGDGVLIRDLGVSTGGDGETGAPVNIQLFGCVLGSTGIPSGNDGNGVEGAGYGLNVDGASKVTVHGGTMVGNATGTYSAHATSTVIIRDGYGPAGAAINAGDAAASLAGVAVVQGDLLYGSGAITLARLVKDTNSTRYLSNTGSSNNPAWAQVNLSNGVTGTLPVANGGTNYTGGSWTTYVPTITAASGSGTFTNPEGRYLKIGRLVNYCAKVTITNIGTASGAMRISLPFDVASITPLVAHNGTTFVHQIAQASPGNSRIDVFTPSAAAFPGTTGDVIHVSGVFEASS